MLLYSLPVLAFCAISLSGLLLIQSTHPPFDDYTTTRPTAVALTGTYVPNAWSHQWLEQNGFASLTPELILRSDGTFVLSGLPEAVFSGWFVTLSNNPIVSAEGRWDVTQEADGWRVVLHGSADSSAFNKSYRLRHNHRPFCLHFPLQDRDIGFPFILEQSERTAYHRNDPVGPVRHGA